MADVICKIGATCTEKEVGPFMQGISTACGNKGDCTLVDIMSVVANIGNWILGIVALVVFVIYIYGGIKILMGGAKPDFVAQGKTAIKTATVGLVIVFVANLGLTSIKGLLTTGSVGGGAVGQCTANNIGSSCGKNMVCTSEAGCVSKCLAENGINGPFQCRDTSDYNDPLVDKWCEKNKCPEGESNLCCDYNKLEAEQAIESERALQEIERIRTGSSSSRPEEP